jgi:gluconolactonase
MTISSRIEPVLNLAFYTEGPGLDAFGNLFFTTLRGGAIMKMDPEGKVSRWAQMSCPNGQKILPNGHHLVCETGLKAVVELDSAGHLIRQSTWKICAGRAFSSPNDLIVDEQGGFYFTDSVRHRGQVFYVGASGQEKRVLSQLDYPNGIALSKDGQQLFVAESYTNRILVVELAEAGIAPKEPEVFIDLPLNPLPLDPERMPFTANLPDGIAFDDLGRLWVAHYGMGALQVVDQGGKHLATVPTGIPATSNLCFRPDFNSIYVSGGSGEPGPGMIHKIIIDR